MEITQETLAAFRDEFEKISEGLSRKVVGTALGKRMLRAGAKTEAEAAKVMAERPIYNKWIKRRGRFDAEGKDLKSHMLEAMGKTAGEMQGYTRIGRKPISIDKMLENELEVESPTDELLKAAAVSGRTLALLAAGGLGALTARQMNEDRKLGRMVRKQQQAQGQ